MKQSSYYLSYLLRLWRSGRDDTAVWRASLESPIAGERRGFANLRDLFAFLEAVTSENVEEESPTDSGEQRWC